MAARSDQGERAAARPVLVLAHASAVTEAVEYASTRWSGSELDVLAYGRVSGDLPIPAPARRIDLPSGLGPSSAASFLSGLRQRRYRAALVAQPQLADNFMRGALLAFPHLAGAREVVASEAPRSEDPTAVPRLYALADLVRWVSWRALAAPVMALAPLLVTLVGRLSRPVRERLPLAVSEGQTVVYLRTDLELAGARLEQGGSAAHTLGIVGALQRRGLELRYWGTGSIAGLPAGVADVRLPSVSQANRPRELSELLAGLRQARWGSGSAVDSSGVALVYQRYSLNNLAGAMLARRWGVPFVLEANASEVEWRRAAGTLAYPRLAQACERLLLARSARIATVSENAAQELLAAGADSERLAVVPNAVEVERFAGARPEPLPFPEDSFVIGFAGSFYPWHGVRVLVEAFAELHERCPQARLLLVGDGEDRPHAEDILRRRAKSDYAQLTGALPAAAVPGYLAACTVLASPHAAEDGFIGSPIKLFEYMATGRPIVASRLAQLGELLRDEQTALLVTPGDRGELCAALERLHDDPDLRGRLGRAASEEAARLHTWDARVDRILGDD